MRETQTTTYTYTPQIQTFTNPANSETVAFDFHNLTRIDYPDGEDERFSVDGAGNVTGHTDRAGETWTYTYNGRGQILSATNPTGGVITHSYNADGTAATLSDSDTGITTYGYDAYKRAEPSDLA